MIEILIGKEEFKNDIYELVKAFYPGEQFTVTVDEQVDGIQVKLPGSDVQMAEEGACPVRVLEIRDTWSDRQEPRKERKSAMKRMLYQALSARTGRELPWGTLTGIRPVRIPMVLLEAGIGEEEIAQQMRQTYYASDEKIDLAIDIARRERHVLRAIDYEDGYSLYVGIPFCPSICLYCSFSSYPYEKFGHLAEQYLAAMFQEIDAVAEIFVGKRLNTIYVGGGTPTTLTAEQLDRLLYKLEDSFSYEYLKELTVEAGRPDSITEDRLMAMKRHRVTRISINPQTMQQKTLDLIGRKHTVEQTKEAFHLARGLRFDNINMDLILGLPGETAADVRSTMEEIRKLSPDSVTLHSLALKRVARLNLEKEKYEPVSAEEMGRMMDIASSYAADMGLKPYYLYRQKNMAGNYENVGYAKVDKAGIYNILIMEEKQTIVACGAGASTKAVIHSENRIERVENVKNVEQYIDRIGEMIDRKRQFFEKNPVSGALSQEQVAMDDLERELAHGMTVSCLARRLGRELGLSEEEQYQLAVAGLLHDIGKCKLSGYLYGNAQIELNVEKMKYVRTHSRLSYDILKEKGYEEPILEAVRYHHENYDGSGYPDNLAGEDIPYMARILRVCDVFAALTSDRRYRSAFSADTAMELMIEEIKNFDMGIFLAFQRIAHEAGTADLLNTKLHIQEEEE